MDDRSIPMSRWVWGAVLAATFTAEAAAQPPVASVPPPIPGAPAPAPTGPVCNKRGRIHRMFHHVTHTLDDDFIGSPAAFYEPPLGSYINRQFAIQVSKADTHRFAVYDTDFLPGTDLFSPIGASRFNLMYGRLPAWPGPIAVEWTPDRPELAEARRRKIVETLAAAGCPMPAERVVIGPSPYPGGIGTEGAGHFNNMVSRSESAVLAFPLPPTTSANMGVR